MYRSVIAGVAALCVVGANGAERLPAFPGAEGFGKYAAGGRGGDVYHVTTLADSGPGSLRAGLESATASRTIVFDVAGTITLKKPLAIKGKSKLTIAGQTAPGKGITIRDWPVTIYDSRDIVMRYVRVRLGDENKPKGGQDVMTVNNNDNVILDHLSLSWGIDGNSDYRANSNMTLQWLIYSEALDHSIHEKGGHAMCTSIRDCTGNTSVHHNIYATSRNRHPTLGSGTPKKGGDPLLDFRNCINYNWSGPTNLGGLRLNVVANYYRPGPESKAETQPFHIKDGDLLKARGYMRGNFFESLRDLWNRDNYSAVLYENTGNYKSMSRKEWEVSSEFAVGEFAIPTQTAKEAYDACLRLAGASLMRDAVDERFIQDVRERKGKLIDSQKEVGGWDNYPELHRPADFDTDGDGMPDAWERSHGLNAKDASDGKQVGKSGYTRLEEYLNSLVRSELKMH